MKARRVAGAPERIEWAVQQLAVEPADHLLEVGCGGGYAVALVCGLLARGTITAIDRSALQVARARARNSACVAAGQARIERAALEDLVVGRRRFDKIFAVNVNAFWTTPAGSLACIRPLLRPRGDVYLVYQPPTAARLRAVKAALSALLESHGFAVRRVETQAFRVGHGLCIIGRPK